MTQIKKIVITGGSGFIGSHLVKMALDKNYVVLNIDKLSYCSNSIKYNHKNLIFRKIDLLNCSLLYKTLKNFKPDAIIHCAAETHVDNSIKNPKVFIDSNITSTFNILNFLRESKKKIKYIHISTDEVFGSLKNKNKKFNLSSKYDPQSPYAASKAGSDFFVRSFGNTYNIKYTITNCSNNYGPYQYLEKLIPLTIIKCIQKKNIPVYGNGDNIREWIFVKDHCEAILKILKKNNPKTTYLIGSKNEKKNIDVVRAICDYFSKNDNKKFDYNSLITFVKDRKGHDYRYSLDYTQTSKNLNWKPISNFSKSLENTIEFYIHNYHLLKKIFPYEKKNNYIW
jgi:dTDP-glucose 4,6-dehydratase